MTHFKNHEYSTLDVAHKQLKFDFKDLKNKFEVS